MAKFDNANVQHGSDVVADNVTKIPAAPVTNQMVYLTVTDGAYAPGLYIYSETGAWVLLSNGDVVT